MSSLEWNQELQEVDRQCPSIPWPNYPYLGCIGYERDQKGCTNHPALSASLESVHSIEDRSPGTDHSLSHLRDTMAGRGLMSSVKSSEVMTMIVESYAS